MSDIIERQVAITIPITPKGDREYQTYNLDDAYEQGWEDLQEMIEQLPAADAIPIEWLEQLLDDAELAGQPYTINILKRILSRWEKEKENGSD